MIEDLGYSSANAQLLTIPIYVFAMIMVIIFAFWSEHVQQRSPFIMAGYVSVPKRKDTMSIDIRTNPCMLLR